VNEDFNAALKKNGGGVISADLSTVTACKSTAAEVVQRLAGAKISTLAFTVGILSKSREETVDGIECEMMLHYLCRFILLNTLLPEVAASDGLKPRVLNLATASLPVPAIDFSDFNGRPDPGTHLVRTSRPFWRTT
jgi:hypothetical protein